MEPRSSVTREPGKIFICSSHWLYTEELRCPVYMGQGQGKRIGVFLLDSLVYALVNVICKRTMSWVFSIDICFTKSTLCNQLGGAHLFRA
jgi:hypothetical protein